MSDYQIGEPVPMPSPPNRPGKYRDIWDALPALEDGMAIPLVFESVEQAMKAAGSIYVTARNHGAKVSRAGNTVYVSRAK